MWSIWQIKGEFLKLAQNNYYLPVISIRIAPAMVSSTVQGSIRSGDRSVGYTFPTSFNEYHISNSYKTRLQLVQHVPGPLPRNKGNTAR